MRTGRKAGSFYFEGSDIGRSTYNNYTPPVKEARW